MTDKSPDIETNGKSRLELDRDDLNREMAGTQHSKIKRFLSDDFAYCANGENSEKKAARQFQTMLDILLAQDAQYAALYHQVSEKLDKAYQAVDIALIEINQKIALHTERLETIRENAHRLEDGTIVFKSSNDGHIYFENGERLHTDSIGTINIPENAPSWELYQFEKAPLEAANQQKLEVKAYKNELDNIHYSINDAGNPPSLNDMKKHKHVLNNMSESLSKYHDDTPTSEPEHKETSNPSLGFSIPQI